MNTNNYITLRVRKGTQYKLKIVAALCNESMLDVLDRLVSVEYERLQRGDQKGAEHQKDQA